MFKNLVITCFLGLVAVILGAFGAHALKEVLNPAQLLSFETAVRYQMFHAIVLLFVFTTPKEQDQLLVFWGYFLVFRFDICAPTNMDYGKVNLVCNPVGWAFFDRRMEFDDCDIFTKIT